MFRFVLRRLLGTLAILLVLSFLTFFLARAVPGGPYAYGEIPLSDAQKALFAQKYGLNRPLWEQYAVFLLNALRLDFGVSFQSPSESVTEIIARTWPISIHLGGMAAFIAITVGIALGIVAAYNHNRRIDYLATLLATFTITTPNFVIGIGLILLFSVALRWLPTGGWAGPETWIMPVIAMTLGSLGTVVRYTRGAVLDVLMSDFVRTARSKGLTEFQVAWRHVLRNALITILTAVLPIIPGMITGTIFIEGLFRIPGLGKWFVSSSFTRDYPMIMGITMLWAALISLTYLLTDILYALVDPRIRFTSEGAR